MKWLTVKELSKLLKVSPQAINKNLKEDGSCVETRNYSFKYRFVKGIRGVENRALRKNHYEISLESLNERYQVEYARMVAEDVEETGKLRASDELSKVVERETGQDAYNCAAEWQREKANTRERCIRECEDLKGKDLEEWIALIWNVKNPDDATSYKSLCRWKKLYKDYGIGGLLTGYGKNNSKTDGNNKYLTFKNDTRDYYSVIKESWYKIFRESYLKDGGPSLEVSWQKALGYASINEETFNFATFPNKQTFKRAVFAQYGESGVYYARNGEWKWNKKHGYFVSRDSSDIAPGDVWVSDHAQLDVGVIGRDGKVAFPWITVWQDFKTGKWLGWTLFVGNPNSDRIFEVFYKSAVKFGLPKRILIDNGKDYRSKDFAGGRPKAHAQKIPVNKLKIVENKIKVVVGEESEPISMVHRMGIEVSFSLPYNAQAKPIERGFNTLKEAFSKDQVGYRGGNVVERPEILQQNIKDGKLPTIEELEPRFNKYIDEFINMKINNGKYHKGRSRNKMWEDECQGLRMVEADTLRLFCMRTSKPIKINRNVVFDKIDNLRYHAPWMVSREGEYVYLRRDPLNYNEAWVYDMQDKFIDKAFMEKDVSAFATDITTREDVKAGMRKKRHAIKVMKEAVQLKSHDGEAQDDLMYAAVYEQAKAAGQLPTGKADAIQGYVETEFDSVMTAVAERESEGRYDAHMFDDIVKKEDVKIDIWKQKEE